jgi:hypothetical protein
MSQTVAFIMTNFRLTCYKDNFSLSRPYTHVPEMALSKVTMTAK